MTSRIPSKSDFNLINTLKYQQIGSQAPLKHLVNAYVKKNIQQLNCENTVLNFHRAPLGKLLAFDDSIISAGAKITCWNTHTHTCKTVYESTEDVEWLEMKLMQERSKLVCLSIIDDFKVRLQILSLKDNFQEINVISNKQIQAARTLEVVGNRFFTEYQDSSNLKTSIAEWDEQGNTVALYPFPDNLRTSALLYLKETTDYLVAINKKLAVFYDLKGNQAPKILSPTTVLESETEEDFCITAAHAEGYRLLVGMRKQIPCSKPICQLFDISSGSLLKTYKLETSSLFNESITYSISCLIVEKQWAYLGLVYGTVIALNLEDQTFTLLGHHPRSVSFILLQDDILVTGSKGTVVIAGTILLFDITKRELLNKILYPSLHALVYDKRRLLAGVEGALVMRDFETVNLGESDSPKSEKHVDQLMESISLLLCSQQ